MLTSLKRSDLAWVWVRVGVRVRVTSLKRPDLAWSREGGVEVN